MFEGFVNPGLVAGALLAGVPLIIHLLNRQRHRPTPWAAMRFVLAAYRKTRRRVQLENLLLLLLRMAAIAVLALAVARPFTGSEGPLSGLTESRRDVAIVIDGSASTGYRSEVDTVFERILARARDVVGKLDGERGDRALLVLGGAWPRTLALGDPAQAAAALDSLHEPTDESLDLALALGEVLDFAREEAASTEQGRVEIFVLSDLQRGAFQEALRDEAGSPFDAVPEATGADASEEASEPGRLFDVLDELEGLGLVVRVEDLAGGGALPPNLSIEGVAIEGPILGQGAPVEVRVTVANHGAGAKAAVRVALEVDGVRRPSQVVDVEGLASADAIFPVVFDSPGDHVLRALLEGDRLAADDVRVQVLHVPEPVRVLVVNGAPSADFERDAVARLMVVLEPSLGDDASVSGLAPFDPREVEARDVEGGDVELGDFDLVWLADVDSVSPELAAVLEEEVASGTSLVLSLGEHVQLDAFNARFFRPDGSGLSPAELERRVAVASRRQGYYRVEDFDATHPALSLFAEKHWTSLLTEAPFYQFVATRPVEGSRVLARLDDAASSPLFLEREYDRGRVWLWTSSMEESWTGLPTWGPTLVPFIHDFVRAAGAPTRPSASLAPGDPFVAEVRRFPRGVELVLPGDTRRTIDVEAEEVSGDRWRLPPLAGLDTARAGLYRIVTEGAGELAFAVQIPAAESDLARLAHDELEGLHGALQAAESESEETRGTGVPAGRGELWRGLALFVLLALVAESLWSAWIGHRRKLA